MSAAFRLLKLLLDFHFEVNTVELTEADLRRDRKRRQEAASGRPAGRCHRRRAKTTNKIIKTTTKNQSQDESVKVSKGAG